MNEMLYRFVSWGFDELIWCGDLLGEENLPERGPAVFVSNHLGALGPIAVGASIPFQLHAWIHAAMLDPRLAPEYLRGDFVEPQLHISAPVSIWLAQAISKIHIPLLRAVGCIPVYHTPEELHETFRMTIDRLLDGKYILIFPEDPDLPLDLRYNMRPFKKGFARLGELYYAETRQALSFYPLAVHAETRTICVGKPIRYNYLNNPASERQRIKSMLEQGIHQMLLQASQDGYLSLLLPS
jgi:hypothetical protein